MQANRHGGWATLSAALLLQAGRAFAQDEGDAADRSGGETEAREAVDNHPTRVKVPTQSGAKETIPGEVHTVVRGDTLWDLSQHYLGTPWYWPKVWSYNPQIANPHWIYPGNKVRFFQDGDEGGSRVEVSESDGDAQGGDVNDDVTSSESMAGEDEVTATGKLVYTPKSTMPVLREGFLTPRELDDTGTITSSSSEAMMLSPPDEAGVTFKRRSDVKVGERYAVFRTLEKVHHPVTGRFMGFITQITGILKVVSMDSETVRTRVVAAYDEIARGDRVGPSGEKLMAQLGPRANDRDAKGYVLSALVPYLTMMGERSLILVDQGSRDGVQAGNTFTVIRQVDGTGDFLHPEKDQKSKLPIEEIATCMALDVKEQATTCMLVHSLREVVPGDRIVMRAAAPLSSQPAKVGVLLR